MNYSIILLDFPMVFLSQAHAIFQTDNTILNMGKHQSKMKPSTMGDLRSVTQFSDAEIIEIHKCFLKHTHSGLITLEEFETMYKMFFPYGDASAFAKHVFRTFDTNGDNYIDFKEFLCALTITSKGKTDEKLKLAFNMYDIDKDGFISQGEMLEIIISTAKMVQVMVNESTTEKRMAKIFKQMDTNRDGQISLEEFNEGAQHNPGVCKIYKYFPPQ